MNPTKNTGFYCVTDQKVHDVSNFSLKTSDDFFESEDGQRFCLENNSLYKYTSETDSFTQISLLPQGTFLARFLGNLLLAVNGDLNLMMEKREWRKVVLKKPAKYCPHGVASTSNDKISINSLAIGSTSCVAVDGKGQLWTFEKKSLLENENTSIIARRLPLMGGMRRCTKIVAGRKHFLALVTRQPNSEKQFDSDDLDDSISRKLQLNELNFQNCDKCQEDGKMRLSAMMKLADQEHNDMRKFLETDEGMRNLSSKTEKSLQRQNGQKSSMKNSVKNTKAKQLKKLHSEMGNRQRNVSSTEENKEQSSVMSFLSIDRLSLQMRNDRDSPTFSEQQTLRKKKQTFEIPDDFVEVWSWGENIHGQLGHGDSVNRKEPFPISILTEYHVVDIACGQQFSMALTANGEVLSWGESLQPSTALTFNSTPQILKIGYDQVALGISAFKEQSAILILSSNGPAFCLHSTKDSQTKNRSIQKLPPFVKDHICVDTSVFETTIGFRTVEKSAPVEESFTCWMEAVRLGRLLRALSKMSQQFHENSRATCAEDQSAVVADLLHKFHLATVCAAGSMARLSSSLRKSLISAEFLDPTEVLGLCATEVFTNPLIHYFDALCDAVVFGSFVGISLGSEMDQQVSRLCLVYGTESSSLSSRLQKLCFKVTNFWSTIKCNASELMAVEADSNRRRELQEIISRVQSSLNYANQSISDARRTNSYWQKPYDENTLALLRAPGRKLLICMPINGDGEIVKITTILPKSLLQPKYHGAIIFNDIVIFLEKKDYKLLPLELIWLQNETINLTSPSLTLIAPETQILLEFQSDVERNKFMTACESWSTKKPAPQKRFGQYTFSNPSSDLIGSTYEGSWFCGKPHGRGVLKYEDETCYEGQFTEGEYHGFGVLTVPHFTQSEKDSSFSSFFLGSPSRKTEQVTEFKGVFRRGKLCGLGRIRYPNGDIYEGYCEGGEPHGFGMHQWDRGKYLGGWKEGKRHGYGVHSSRKARYMGEYNNDKLQGRGSRVTIDGCYHEGTWSDDRITYGRIVCPPKVSQPHFSVEYEGDLEDYGTLSGKGFLKVAPNTVISGSFSGDLLKDQIQMTNTQMFIKEKPINLKEKNGQLIVEEGETAIEKFYNEEGAQESGYVPPCTERWQKMFDIFIEEELGGNFTESALVWQKIVSGIRKGKEMSGKMHETGPFPHTVLERIPPYDDPWSPGYRTMLTEYFNAAINYEPHPLWRLCHGSVDLFTCSYNNMAAHSSMYSQSTLELKSLIEENYKVIRFLFPSLPEHPYEVFAESLSRRESSLNGNSSESSPDGSPSKLNKSDPLPPIEAPTPACEFLYEFFFPRISPILSTIYSLSIAELDSIYWRKALYLNAHTDIKLLEYFLVPKELWPIEMPVVNDLEKPLIRALARKKFYESAILALQQLPTDANPSTKLAILVDTFEEISQCVLNYADAGSDHVWGGDDQFPVMIYIVVRAGIQHLGSEIRLLDNFTREFRSGNAVDMMFTMLKAAYIQILTDKWVA